MALRPRRTRQDALLAAWFLLLLGQVCPCGATEEIPKECGLGANSGYYGASVKRYYFDPYIMRCDYYYYRRCGGNENQVFTIVSCLDYCLPEKNHREFCLLPKDSGFCMANILSWYYDAYSQTCKEFYFYGCRGNENNFPTKEECELTCHMIKSTPERRALSGKREDPPYAYDP